MYTPTGSTWDFWLMILLYRCLGILKISSCNLSSEIHSLLLWKRAWISQQRCQKLPPKLASSPFRWAPMITANKCHSYVSSILRRKVVWTRGQRKPWNTVIKDLLRGWKSTLRLSTPMAGTNKWQPVHFPMESKIHSCNGRWFNCSCAVNVKILTGHISWTASAAARVMWECPVNRGCCTAQHNC